MQFTTFALLAVAAATVSASAPQAYGEGAKSAQVYTFETKKAEPTKAAEYYRTYKAEAYSACSTEKPVATKNPKAYGEEKKAEAYPEEEKPEAYAEPTKSAYKDPHHSAPAKATPTMAAPKVEDPEKEAPETTCARGSEISCCNTDSSGSDLLGNILGGSCALQNLSLLSALNSNCGAGNTFCCPTNQDGTLNINLSCIPITL